MFAMIFTQNLDSNKNTHMIKRILFLFACISIVSANAQPVDSVTYRFTAYHTFYYEKLTLYDNGEFKYTTLYEIGGERPAIYGHWKRCDNRLILSCEPSDKDFNVKEIGKSPKNRMFFYARGSENSPINNYRFWGITADKQDTIILMSDFSGRLTVNCRIKAFWIAYGLISSPTYKLSENTNEVYITFNGKREFHDEEWIFEHEDTLRPRNEQGELLKYVLTRQKYEKVE